MSKKIHIKQPKFYKMCGIAGGVNIIANLDFLHNSLKHRGLDCLASDGIGIFLKVC